MNITLKLYTVLREYLPGDLKDNILSIPDNSRVVDVINMLKIPDELPKIILINGAQKKPESELSEGDELSIFPPISGG
jgi:molybdopterin converting factor small subunit